MAAPRTAPARLVEMSADVRAAVLLDPAGSLVAASGADKARGRRLGELAYDLVLAADAASSEPTAQIEAQVPGGGVFALRDTNYTLACVTKRLALPALVLYDMRMTMLDIEAAA